MVGCSLTSYQIRLGGGYVIVSAPNVGSCTFSMDVFAVTMKGHAREALSVLAVGNVDVLPPHSEGNDERKEQGE